MIWNLVQIGWRPSLEILILTVIAASFNMLLLPFAWALLLQAVIILAAVYWQRPRVA